jgi:ABC-2 type transport system permease protein
MLLDLASVMIVFIAGTLDGVKIPRDVALAGIPGVGHGAIVFAAFGLLMGYLLPSENVMQIIGPVLAAFAFFGGLFVPVSLLPSTLQNIAPYMPTYG